MREIDLKSVLVAGAIGATLMIIWGFLIAEPPPATSSVTSAAGTGFVIGAGVQVGVRLLGVS
jgi:hypothetical protein